MTPAERAAKITELRAEADRLEREGERNWPEKVEAGMLFQHDEGATYIFPARDCDDLLCVIGDDTDKPGDYYSRDLFRSEPQHFTYLGHARDLLTIKTPDAPEPTGAELVGKVCEFAIEEHEFGYWRDDLCIEFDPESERPYRRAGGDAFPRARLAKDRS